MANAEVPIRAQVMDESQHGVGIRQTLPVGQLFLGDCLEIAPTLPPGRIDFIYLDPPFFTKRKHISAARLQAAPDQESSQPLSFEDRWQGGLREYLAWLELRIRACRRLLKPRGVFLLHLDWHAVHYAKVLCDPVFAETGGVLENELIWYYQTGGASRDRFSRKHDTILLYSMREGDFHFDGEEVAIPRTPKAMKRAHCPTGARIKATDTHKNPDDVLLVPALNPMAIERTGYPTQKPVALLELLIKALCPKKGVVGDFFCGSGTTLVAARQLGTQWIGCDNNPAALEIARRRLAVPFGL
jgi:site-specific DNA-methyltransferase (adenine-specific)